MTSKLSHCDILDWHDGVVQAVVQLEDSSGFYYASLIAWDLEGRRRAYAVLAISKSAAAGLSEFVADKALSEENWALLGERVRGIWDAARGDAQLWRCGDTIHDVSAVEFLPAKELSPWVGVDAGEALDPQRVATWLR